MEEEPDCQPNPNPNPNTPSPCDVCGENPWKYRCPSCSIRTCSLPCVKSHKLRTSCTGQKDRSEIVPLSRFDDLLLLSDYNFLEDAKRVADSARRARFGIGGNLSTWLPMRLRLLRNAANRRRTRLFFLPLGMSKREKNQSRYDKRNKSILWTIEWRFHATNIVLVDHGVDEGMNLYSLVHKHLNPSPWNHQLRPFCTEQIENLRFFLQKNPKGRNALFRELNLNVPLGQQMADIVIVEYPVIYVHLPSHDCNFEIEKKAKPFSTDDKQTELLESIPSPKGIVFREDEIEDDNSSDTHVMDLLHYMNPVSNDFRKPKEALVAALSDASMPRKAVESSNTVLGNERQLDEEEQHSPAISNTNSSMVCDFEFEQDLKDAYSDLIGEINPDDFLCLDGGYSDEGEIGERKGACLDFGGSFLGEELEEGEIPSYR